MSVVRTTFKVYGKRQTLTLNQPKTLNRSSSNLNGAKYTPLLFEIYYTFWSLNSPTGESVRPIFTLNTSNDAVLRRQVPFYCYKINNLFFIYVFEKFDKKIQWRLWEKFKNSLNCHNFGCVQDRVVIFGSRYGFRGRIFTFHTS